MDAAVGMPFSSMKSFTCAGMFLLPSASRPSRNPVPATVGCRECGEMCAAFEPISCSSRESCSQRAVTAIFDTLYGPSEVWRRPTTEEVVTTKVLLPEGSGPALTMAGRKALMTCMAPRTFTLKIGAQAAWLPFMILPPSLPRIPALLKRKDTGTPENPSETFLWATSQFSNFVTSQCMQRTPSDPAARSLGSAASSSLAETSRMASRMPRPARRRATSRPKPEAPPVMTATPDVSRDAATLMAATGALSEGGWCPEQANCL
mmetsp:Transcript_104467/g.322306  ORF Transcript_104467/g.322306 Transcript_104467/m.322306 type:complete len:262 (-) Transcript_104467:15-800(-)